MKAKNVKQIKSTKSAAAQQHAFRVILRGSKAKGKKMVRVRHVFTVPALDEGDAAKAAEAKAAAIIRNEKLTNEYVSVLPPLVKAA